MLWVLIISTSMSNEPTIYVFVEKYLFERVDRGGGDMGIRGAGDGGKGAGDGGRGGRGQGKRGQG